MSPYVLHSPPFKLLLKTCCTNKIYRYCFFLQVIWGVIGIKQCLCIPVCFYRPFHLNTLISLLLYLFCHRALCSWGPQSSGHAVDNLKLESPSSFLLSQRVGMCCEFVQVPLKTRRLRVEGRVRHAVFRWGGGVVCRCLQTNASLSESVILDTGAEWAQPHNKFSRTPEVLSLDVSLQLRALDNVVVAQTTQSYLLEVHLKKNVTSAKFNRESSTDGVWMQDFMSVSLEL